MKIKYKDYIREDVNPDDPYNEEDWGEIRKIDNVYVIYVIGQDMNFLCQKKFRLMNDVINPRDRRERIIHWRDYYYEMAHVRGGVDDNFDSNCTIRDAYECHNKEGVLDGTELIGYVERMNITRFDTLQNLCEKLRISIDSVKLYNGYN